MKKFFRLFIIFFVCFFAISCTQAEIDFWGIDPSFFSVSTNNSKKELTHLESIKKVCLANKSTFVNSSILSSENTTELGTYVYTYTSNTLDKLQVEFTNDTYFNNLSSINIWYGNSINGTYGTIYDIQGFSGAELQNKTLIIPSNTITIEYKFLSVGSCFSVEYIGEIKSECTENLFYYIYNNEAIITGCDYLEIDSLIIPDEINNYPVTTIAKRAFSNNKCPEEITIPASINTIEEDAFFFSFNIKKVTIESLESWFNIDFESSYSNPFANRQNTDLKFYLNDIEINNIVVPDSVKRLKSYCLTQLKLTKLDLNNVEYIEAYAIDHCDIYCLNIRANLLFVEDYLYIPNTFGYATQIHNLVFDSRNIELNVNLFFKENIHIYSGMAQENLEKYIITPSNITCNYILH